MTAGKFLHTEFSAQFVSIDIIGRESVIGFGDGYAFLRPFTNGLHLRVEAADFVTFVGIRSLLTIGLTLSKRGGPQVGGFDWIFEKEARSSEMIDAL
ncbi:hypothetical protein Q644_15345 [Brucella intermedia 229E]|uniref:Uncharacterized protein n=1 Tax=Brucella intermedia 229E TaxID=1337887 RepID=U4VEG6_9HYPH|nr:hypothetical protein Q644_15345 [Brucella intermedia 229E]